MLPRRTFLGALVLAPLAGCHAPADLTGANLSSPPEPIPAKLVGPAGLVELIKFDPTIRLDLRYATPNNFTGHTLYGQARAFMAADAAAALIRAHARAKAEGFGFTIFDAYRPWRVTKKLWDATPVGPKRNYVANPKKGSRHNRGCAVDLTLHDLKTGQLVEMPTGFDDFTARAGRSAPTTNPTASANELRLQIYMEAEGFFGLTNEWWHFDFVGWQHHPVLDIPFESL
jgi:zinc D-Ala-D-Ala dipeptidase